MTSGNPDKASEQPRGKTAEKTAGKSSHPAAGTKAARAEQTALSALFSVGKLSDERRAALLAQDHPGVRVPPPLVYLISLLVGCAVDSPWIYGDGTAVGQLVLGAAIVAAGFCPILWAFRLQRDAETNVEPWKPTTAIIDRGPYKHTRNPMYLGMAIANIGLAVMAGSVWAIGTLMIGLIVIDRCVIDKEEAYLEAKFGQGYLSYKARVRRWI